MFFFMLAYLAGALSILVIEAGILLFFLQRVPRRGQSRQSRSICLAAEPVLVSHNSSSFSLSQEGKIWVAVIGSLDKHQDTKGAFNQQVKGLKELKAKKDSLKENPEVSPIQKYARLKELKAKKDSLKENPEVSPIQKYARLKEHKLILSDGDGSEEIIELGGCVVRAVSGGDESTRKWAKRYPIKLENQNRVLLSGSRTCFIYLETSWEKEAWCKALRLASRTDLGGSDPGGVEWYCNLKKDFEEYFQCVNEDYPSFLKSNPALSTQKERNIKEVVVSSSKIRNFVKKITRKAPKIGHEAKISNIPTSIQDEKQISDKGFMKLRSSSLTDISIRGTSAGKNREKYLHTESPFLSSSSMQGSLGNQIRTSVSDRDPEKSSISDSDADHEKGIIDQGTLCCNLLVSRLFFDVKRSPEIMVQFQALIQKLLSKVRTPSYVGGINCTRVDVGKLPPHICNIRVLPVSIDEAWALEADIEYCGGALMDIETRIEACEPSFQEKMASSSIESQIAVEAAESLRKQLQPVSEEKKDKGESSDGTKASNIATQKSSTSSWKGMLSHLADQVSQVPIVLSVRVLSLKGTVRISIKPPPSDRIWFGFTSAPDIEWVLEPSIGDRKITSGAVATLIASRIKAAIRETLIIPNCESICIPWMQSEKDDWVPQRIAPVPWICQESSDDTSVRQRGESSSLKDDVHLSLEDDKSGTDKHSKASANHANNANNASSMTSDIVSGEYPQEQLKTQAEVSSFPNATNYLSNNGSDDLRVPLLDKDELQDKECSEMQIGLVDPSLNYDRSLSETDGKSKKGLKRAKVIDLGKKMGVKFEEKRRHIEEKRRHIVEKMRGIEKNESAGSES